MQIRKKFLKWMLLTLVASFMLSGTNTAILQAEQNDTSYRAYINAMEIKGWPFVYDVSEEFVPAEKFKKEPPYTIGWSTIFQANTWAVQFTQELLDEAKRHPDLVKNVIHVDAGGSIPKQIADIESLIRRGVDAIVFDPITPEALKGVLKEAKRRGIPVIGASSPIPIEYCTAWAGREDEPYGKVQAQWIVSKLNGKGNVIALSGLAGNLVAEKRWEGAKEVFDKYPGIKVVAHEYTDWSYATGKETTANLLAAHPQIDGIWTGGGTLTLGAVEAIESAGRPLPEAIGGGDSWNGWLKFWKKRGIESICFSNPTMHSAVALRLALKILQGEPVPKKVLSTAPYVTNRTLDKFVHMDMPDTYWPANWLSAKTVEKIYGKIPEEWTYSYYKY